MRLPALQPILAVFLAAGCWARLAGVASATDARYYDIGTPTLMDIWVDPTYGNDANTGASRAAALRTLNAAWARVPMGAVLDVTGYHIRLTAGTYTETSAPGYWESRYGTYQYPILIEAADGAGTAVMPSMNIFDCRYFYLAGLRIQAPGGDLIHCERCDHFLVRQTAVIGPDPNTYGSQETVKVNQSQSVYIEDSDISGAYGNAVDFVAVQYGHVQGNRIHNAGDWCMYVKGGSASFRVEGNEYYDCGTGGFTAGQGTGFEYMVSPWLHYEAYDIKFINNLVHDTEGAGMGVNGGYNILMAYNTLYRVGHRSHVLEFVFGLRSCDGDTARCAAHLAAGGWGRGTTGAEEPIPNRNVYVYNNIVYNPGAYQSQWQHFAVYGPRSPSAGSNIPAPARADTNLQIRGNIIWNGPPDQPLGIEDASQGCQPANPTCNAAQLRAENAINTIEPQLINAAGGNFRPLIGGNVFTATTYSASDFAGGDRPQPPLAPAGDLSNSVPRDYGGAPRAGPSLPGAYAGPSLCGNGALDPGESCDDGNLVDGDGCDSNCTPTACGNGIVTTGEECDDGNRVDTDGCRNDCTANRCGDGVVYTGAEECDDGNNTDGDGCSSSCQSELIPGGGSIAADCTQEWQVALVPARNSRGIPMKRQACTEGDPACDFGPAGDNACVFHVKLCFNVTEWRFQCSASDVAAIQLSAPRRAIDKANRDALEAVLRGVGGSVNGKCSQGPRRGQACATDGGCDSAPSSGDGMCERRLVTFEPGLSAADGCTDLASITVPLKQARTTFRTGTKTMKLTASPSNDPVTGKRRPADTDSLTLVCKPRP